MTRLRLLVCFAVAAVLLGAAGFGATRLGLDARTATLAPASQASDATAEYARSFGGDPVVVLVQAPWQVATGTRNLIILASLEGRLQHVPGVRAVEGPGTLVNSAATAALDVALTALRADAKTAGDAARATAQKAGRSAADAEAAARAEEVATLRRDTVSLLDRFPQIRETGVPSLDNPRFVSAFLFRRDGSVKPLYRSFFPRPGATLVAVRLADNAGLGTVRQLRDTVTATLRQFPLQGAQVVVSGAPVVEEALTRASATDLRAVLPVAAIAMIAILLLLLRGRFALLPVPVALAGVVYTAGALDLLRRPTTLAAIAAVPILLGLITDYVVQLGAGGAREDGAATMATVRRRARALGLAAGATAAGALVLVVSPIPVVRSIGMVVAIGVACGLLALLLIAVPLLVRGRIGAGGGTRARLQRITGCIGAAGMRRSTAVLAVALITGAAGLALAPLQRTTTDIRNFASSGLPALRDLGTLERATGAGAEIAVLVDAPDVTAPAVTAWMLAAEKRLAGLLPAGAPPPVSIADLLVTVNQGKVPDPATQRQILAGLPPYLVQNLVTADRRHASVAIGIPLQDLAQQERLLARMRDTLSPPPGANARLAGDAVLAADGEAGLASSGLLMDLLALAAVGAVLLLVTRSARRTVVGLVPMVLATGWTTLVVVALRIQVNPITAVLGALVIALATEFSVIWSARFREALAAGLAPAEAAATTSARTGSAIAVSGLTLCAGFLALAVSSSPLLRSFGLVAGLGVAAAVLAVLLLCPPLCIRLLAPAHARATSGAASATPGHTLSYDTVGGGNR
ncbi:MAG TPA: MMPL family transporter [Candidatus Dormibacteraeota bacterium]